MGESLKKSPADLTVIVERSLGVTEISDHFANKALQEKLETEYLY